MTEKFCDSPAEREAYLKKYPGIAPSNVFVRSGYSGTSYAEYLNYELKQRGWGRMDLVRKLEELGTPIPYPTVVAYSKGDTNPRLDNVLSIAAAFDFSMSEPLYASLNRSWRESPRAERNGQKSVRLMPDWIAPGMNLTADEVGHAVNRRVDSLRKSRQQIVQGATVNTLSSYVNWLIQKDMAEAVKSGVISWREPVSEPENKYEYIGDLKDQIAELRKQVAQLKNEVKKN